jgi:glutamate/tyrosine decarboxylase-like PLP-dependent enzyme
MEVIRWLIEHHRTLSEQPIGRTGSRDQMEALLGGPAPETGQAFAEVLQEFADQVMPNAFKTNHPRFLAFIPGAPNFVSVLGELLCAGTNFFAGVWLEAAAPSQIEVTVLDWLRDLLGMPAGTSGILTSGGSEANLTALTVAREPLSYENRARAVLYVTEQRHWSVDRAAKIIGFRPDQVHPVPADEDFRLAPEALQKAIQQDRSAGRLSWAAVANAGATNTGVIDPLADLSRICREEKVWLHVDAAYGWSAMLTAWGKRELEGIGQCDSVTLDPHKWFGQCFESGCLLVREGKRLAETFTLRPEYMQDVEPEMDQINFCDHGIALTRRFRALKIWLSVKVLGLNWHRELVHRCCQLAEFSEAVLEQHPEFEILSKNLSIVCFRYRPVRGGGEGEQGRGEDREKGRGGERDRPRLGEEDIDRLNLSIIDELRATGKAFISSTRLRGRVALRFCFVNWRSTAADVEEIVRLLLEIGRRLETKVSSERGASAP